MSGNKTNRLLIRVLIGCGLLICCALTVLAVRRFYSMYEQAALRERENQKKIDRELESNFGRIVAPSDDIVVYHNSVPGLVNTTYKSVLSYEKIKTYYGNQLTRSGWVFLIEQKVIYDGQDYGGKELIYCKGGYAATIQHAGQQESQFGWTYAFSMSSGQVKECKE